MTVPTPFDKDAVHGIAKLVRMGLVGLREIIAWADAWVMKLDDSPLWLLELCTAPDVDTAWGLLMATRPDLPANREEANLDANDHLAALFLRYRRGDLSWADFLMEGGNSLDGSFGGPPCEDYFHFLNEFKAAEQPAEEERTRRAEIEAELQSALSRMEAVHRRFEAELRPG
jgi:hypothetical protein